MEEGNIEHLYYKTLGEGRPLLLISGLGADHTTWLPVTFHLAKYFKVILFDNRGIGKSSIPDDGECTIEKMAKDAFLLLEKMNIPKSHVIGHSLGGYVAQELAATYPEKVEKLILLSTKTRAQAAQKLYNETTFSMMQQNLPREIIIKNSLCHLFSNKFLENKKNIEFFIESAMKKPVDESRKSYFYQANAAINFDTSKAASKITAPTLIISGEQDMLATPQDAKHLNQQIKHAQIKILYDMAHMPHLEIPQEISDLIKQFIN
jgi:pimeloyl-ACP methyl ester carboxylesterase